MLVIEKASPYSLVRMPFNLSNKQTGEKNVKVFPWRVESHSNLILQTAIK